MNKKIFFSCCKLKICNYYISHNVLIRTTLPEVEEDILIN